MLEKLLDIEKTYLALREQMMDPAICTDPKKTKEIGKQMSSIEHMYELTVLYKTADSNYKEAKQMLASETDTEMLELAKTQLEESQATIKDLEEKVKLALLPKDENDDKNIYLEVRPAAGGNEAGLFAAELLRAYMLYAQRNNRKTEIIEEQLSDIGGVKFVMVKMSGKNAYAKLKRESGVHRVQRIPATESQGRVHTSTVTIAIMPEVDDVQVDLNPNDIVMDTYAASSSGGQNANKNQTGVRLHHNPTGIIVTIGDSKSQMHNKEKAYNVLKAKLYQLEHDKKGAEERAIRTDQIGNGDRSEKIRTYNFPQDRVTDHRIKHSRSNIPAIMNGQLDDVFDTISIENQTKLLAATQAV